MYWPTKQKRIKVAESCLIGSGLTKLVIVGEAKAIHMTLTRDGKSEIGTTEGILEPHAAPASPGFQQHTSGDQESLCK